MRVRRAWAALAALAVVASAACGGGSASDEPAEESAVVSSTAPGDVGEAGDDAAARDPKPSQGCAASSAPAAGVTDERLTSGGVERAYQLTIPTNYDGTSPLPLFFALHALTVNYHVVAPMSGFAEADETYDFIVVAPSGRIEGTTPFWNAAPTADNYDLTFLGDLLDHLESTLCVDTRRVFSLGMSNGAQTSSLLACRLGDRIAGIAAIAGVEYNEPCDGPAVPVIAFHGVKDPIVPFEGGGLNSVRIADTYFYRGTVPVGTATPVGVEESMRRWAQHNSCDAEPEEERLSPEVRWRHWTGCSAPTELYIVDNGGHAWPGKPQPAFEASFGHGTTDIDASALLFEFLLGDAATTP